MLYLVLVGGSATAEWASERHKIGSGAYTDTSEPLQLSRAGTWPVGPAITDDWPGYPAAFDAPSYRELVDHAYKQTLGAALLQACLVALIVGSVGIALRNVRQTRGG